MAIVRQIIGYVFVFPSALSLLFIGAITFDYSLLDPQGVQTWLPIAVIVMLVLPAVGMVFLAIFLTHPQNADAEIKSGRRAKIWKIIGATYLALGMFFYFAFRADMPAEMQIIDELLPAEKPIATPEAVIVSPEIEIQPEGGGKVPAEAGEEEKGK